MLDTVNKAARKQPGSAVSLKCSFKPAVLSFSVHKYNVSLLEFQLCFALGRVGHHHTVPGGMVKCDVYKSSNVFSQV